jgi:hypothetical protein
MTQAAVRPGNSHPAPDLARRWTEAGSVAQAVAAVIAGQREVEGQPLGDASAAAEWGFLPG